MKKILVLAVVIAAAGGWLFSQYWYFLPGLIQGFLDPIGEYQEVTWEQGPEVRESDKPNVLNPIYAKAIFYQNTDQHKQAKIIYQEMINSNSQFEKAYYNLGYIYLKEDSLEKARRMFSLAIGISPYYTDAFYNRGLCYEKENNFKEAIKDYKQSLNFDPDHELAQAAMERLKNKP